MMMNEVDRLNKLSDAAWTLSVPTSLAIIALLVGCGIGEYSAAR